MGPDLMAAPGNQRYLQRVTFPFDLRGTYSVIMGTLSAVCFEWISTLLEASSFFKKPVISCFSFTSPLTRH